MSEVLQDFMKPSPAICVLGKEYPNRLEAVDSLSRSYAAIFRLEYLRRSPEDITGNVAGAEERAIVLDAINAAIRTLEQTELAAQNVQVGGRAIRTGYTDDEILAGYSGAKKVETQPQDWVWMSVRGQKSGAIYFHIDDPYTERTAGVMNERIPQRLWEMDTDADGNVVLLKTRQGDVPVRRAPAVSHLSREQFEVKKLTMDPWKPGTYVDAGGDRCLNQYRALQIPPRPEEKYFAICNVAEQWLEFIYPGRSSYILNHWAHAIQRPYEKPKTYLVFGGGQGIGKNVLLGLAKYIHTLQGKTIAVNKDTLAGRFSDYLMRPEIQIDEFEMERSDPAYEKVKNKIKSISGSADRYLPVEPKGKPSTQVANIHRLTITTNYAHQVPRDNDDRRAALFNSHVTKAQAKAFYTPLFAAIGVNIDSEGFEYRTLWDMGYGDAFANWLYERDISEFDPHNLPDDLLAMYDDTRKGFEMPQTIVEAIEEIAATYGHWADATVPSDIAEITPDNWPVFIAGQQIFATKCSFVSAAEGEDIQAGRKRNGHTERLLRNAGYIKIDPPNRKKQWIGPLPNKDSAAGAIRVQTALYYDPHRVPHGSKMDDIRSLAAKHIESLTKYWRSEEGVASYWTRDKLETDSF
ncbi:primase-helicase family protein [Paraburkholderia terricola]|uniref:primase-helicase family protein n=1 Tax=Paraburkholderia terricola TaxID=169427 RepID=UPI003ECDA854